jgi:AraC-like DNA-binding protein/quercetin dioxygenase-like cupin family protein
MVDSITKFGHELERLQETTAQCVMIWQAEAPAYCPFHRHPSIELVHHVSGSGVTVMANGQSFAYQPNDVVFYPPGLTHDQTSEQTGTDFCVHFTLPPGTRIFERAIHIPPIVDAQLRGELIQLLDYRPGLSVAEQAILNHRVTVVILRLLSLQSRMESAEHVKDHAQLAYNYVRANAERIRQLGEVADAVGVSGDHLRHLFKARFGVSMQRVWMDAKIARAKNLLAYSTLALKVVARLSGLGNERYFSYVFKRETGLTPGAFRSASMQ